MTTERRQGLILQTLKHLTLKGFHPHGYHHAKLRQQAPHVIAYADPTLDQSLTAAAQMQHRLLLTETLI